MRIAQTDLITLVVATFGRDGVQLAPLFQSLARQSDRQFDIVVVDQNTDDRIIGALNEARASGLTIAHVRLDQPNLSLARNVGLTHAKGVVVGYPDDDCWYEPTVIEEVRRVFMSGDSVDGVVGRWFDKTPERTSRYQLDSAAWRRFRGGDAPSFALFFRTDAVRTHKGFDERLGTGRWFGASEETDLVMRMLAAGACVLHTPDAVIHHPFAATPPLNRAQLWRARSYGRGIGALYAKHRLPLWVRARGVTAPFVMALRTRRPHEQLVLAGATALGRLEGALKWPSLYGRSAGVANSMIAET